MEAQQIHGSLGHDDLRKEGPVRLALGTCRCLYSPPSAQAPGQWVPAEERGPWLRRGLDDR